MAAFLLCSHTAFFGRWGWGGVWPEIEECGRSSLVSLPMRTLILLERAPPLWLHFALIIYLEVPSPWWLELPYMNVRGDKHSVHNRIPQLGRTLDWEGPRPERVPWFSQVWLRRSWFLRSGSMREVGKHWFMDPECTTVLLTIMRINSVIPRS